MHMHCTSYALIVWPRKPPLIIPNASGQIRYISFPNECCKNTHTHKHCVGMDRSDRRQFALKHYLHTRADGGGGATTTAPKTSSRKANVCAPAAKRVCMRASVCVCTYCVHMTNQYQHIAVNYKRAPSPHSLSSILYIVSGHLRSALGAQFVVNLFVSLIWPSTAKRMHMCAHVGRMMWPRRPTTNDRRPSVRWAGPGRMG